VTNVLRAEFFNRSTWILTAAAGIALEPSKRISRVEIAGIDQKPFQRHFSVSIKVGLRFLHCFLHW
jgi:hypothetical protein